VIAMHILVTEQNPGDSADLARRLRYLGCTVSTCHGSGIEICRGVTPGRCPLEGRRPVDLVVTVREERELTAREYGLVCGARSGLPLVLTALDRNDKPPVPDGLRRHAMAMRANALLVGCVDALRDEKIVKAREAR
jgi:hypothetical protein